MLCHKPKRKKSINDHYIEKKKTIMFQSFLISCLDFFPINKKLPEEEKKTCFKFLLLSAEWKKNQFKNQQTLSLLCFYLLIFNF